MASEEGWRSRPGRLVALDDVCWLRSFTYPELVEDDCTDLAAPMAFRVSESALNANLVTGDMGPSGATIGIEGTITTSQMDKSRAYSVGRAPHLTCDNPISPTRQTAPDALVGW